MFIDEIKLVKSMKRLKTWRIWNSLNMNLSHRSCFKIAGKTYYNSGHGQTINSQCAHCDYFLNRNKSDIMRLDITLYRFTLDFIK